MIFSHDGQCTSYHKPWKTISLYSSCMTLTHCEEVEVCLYMEGSSQVVVVWRVNIVLYLWITACLTSCDHGMGRRRGWNVGLGGGGRGWNRIRQEGEGTPKLVEKWGCGGDGEGVGGGKRDGEI